MHAFGSAPAAEAAAAAAVAVPPLVGYASSLMSELERFARGVAREDDRAPTLQREARIPCGARLRSLETIALLRLFSSFSSAIHLDIYDWRLEVDET